MNNGDARPVLSLIVPTRERAHTLSHAIASALAQASDQFEVIVSDNASADSTAEIISAVRDDRLRYVRTDARLSMCDNYEFALSHARGDYVIFIGDDDAVLPGGIDYLIDQIAAALRPTIHMWPMHVYDWPGDESPARIAYLAGETPRRMVELVPLARTAVELGGWRYYSLPSPYHCAVPRALLDAIRTRTGRVFHSTQPDVFTAMALPAFADHAQLLPKMVTMHGRSPKSNGAGFIKAAAQANIDRFLREYDGYRFHPTLDPEAPAAANMIPDAVLIAKDIFPEVYRDTIFDYSAMWAYVCRLRFAPRNYPIKQWRRIRRVHKFRWLQFARFTILHEAAVARRKLLDRTTIPADLRHQAPGTITAMLDQLAAMADPLLPTPSKA